MFLLFLLLEIFVNFWPLFPTQKNSKNLISHEQTTRRDERRAEREHKSKIMVITKIK